MASIIFLGVSLLSIPIVVNQLHDSGITPLSFAEDLQDMSQWIMQDASTLAQSHFKDNINNSLAKKGKPKHYLS